MKPKKKSYFDYIIYALALFLILFLSLHAAMAQDKTSSMIQKGEISQSDEVKTIFALVNESVTKSPFDIKITRYTKRYIAYSMFFWFIMVLAFENSKKNYIHGKEFGTARWGTEGDIRDLFAKNIMEKEIKKANMVRHKIGRWFIKNKIYKECRKQGRLIHRAKLEALQELESEQKKNGTYDRYTHNIKVREIKESVQKEVETSKCRAWEPDRLKAEYKAVLEEISESPLYYENEKKLKRQKAADDYDLKLKDFYSAFNQVRKIKEKYKDADMLFTQTERISLYNWLYNNNTLILGGSGAGKTRGFVMPNILQAHSSYVVTDPKGEILEKAGYFLTEIKGYKIRVLNLDNKALSDGYNPFIYIHPERDGYEERVLSLIETIIINTDGGEKKGGQDPFWDKAERLFLQAIFFFTCDGFCLEERNMNTVIKLIAMLKIEEDEDKYDSDLDYFARIFERRHGSDHIGVQQWKEFRQKASGKTAKSIVISAVARLAPFRTKAVRRIFSYDSMYLEDVGEKKTAIFVVVPPTDPTFNFIAGMLFTQLFQELQYCATQVHKHDGQKLPVPCRFILDEFANTCKIPNFVQILAYARSFGIGIVPILQSLEQIKSMYKDDWGVIVDNCNELLFLGSITHMDTLEYMSKLIGTGTFDKRTTGRTRGRQGSSSENFDVVGRELMKPDEIKKIPKTHCIFNVGDRAPFYSEKFKYETHPNYRYTSDSNKSYSFHFKPELPLENVDADNDNGDDGSRYNEKIVLALPEETELVEEPQKVLKSITTNFSELAPMTDELIDNEEMTKEEEKQFFESLLEEDREVEYRTNNFISTMIKLEENPAVILRNIGKDADKLLPLEDECFENQAYTEEQAELQTEIIFDDLDNGLEEIQGDIFEELENLSELIGADPSFKELLEETA